MAQKGYNIIILKDLLGTPSIGNDGVSKILGTYHCKYNNDVELFLKKSAIVFEEQGIASTYLVFASHKKNPVLIGYFTIANKTLAVPKKNISRTLSKRLLKYGSYNLDKNAYLIPTQLIGQIGKNYNNGFDKLITGDELLTMACNQVKKIQYLSSGKVVYLECEDTSKLVDFYNRNGFFEFEKRQLDPSEKSSFEGSKYLLQMLKIN